MKTKMNVLQLTYKFPSSYNLFSEIFQPDNVLLPFLSNNDRRMCRNEKRGSYRQVMIEQNIGRLEINLAHIRELAVCTEPLHRLVLALMTIAVRVL